MKVQEIDTPRGRRWILLDSEYNPISEVNNYLRFLDNIGRAENTLRSYAYALKLYCEYLAINNLTITSIADNTKIRPLDILADFLIWLQYSTTSIANNILEFHAHEKRSPKTINTILGIVLSFYDYLGRNHIANPLDVYKEKIDMSNFRPFLYEIVRKKHVIQSSLLSLKVPKKTIEFITNEMYEKMLAVCPRWRDKAIIAIMFEGGLRLGETLGLRIYDIEIWNNCINIIARSNNINYCHVKNKAEGVVYVSNRTIEFIAAYLTQEREQVECDYLFVNLSGPNIGAPMQIDTVEKLFARISRNVGTKIHPHMCRHGCATARLEAGWDEQSIQKQLRHVNISTTKMYEHYSDELLLKKTRDYMIKQQERFGWGDAKNDNKE